MLKVEIIGHLGNDAEVKEINGKKYISFSIASKEKYKNTQGETVEKTVWISCLKFGESNVLNYLKKGQSVYCRGNLSAKAFNGKNGVECGLNCNVTEIELVGSARDVSNPNMEAGTNGITE